MRYRPALDGVRALAVIGVVAVHLALFGGLSVRAYDNLVPVVKGGDLGVDVFFVLSGALITSLLLGELDGSGSIAMADFRIRRFRRLAPALLLTLAALVAIQINGVSGTFKPLGPNAWLTVLCIVVFGANWLAAARTTALGWAGVTWSLAIEEQFYLLWPSVLRRMWRAGAGRTRLLTLLVVVGLGCLLYSAALGHGHPDSAYFHTPVRGIGLVVGSAMAIVLHSSPTGAIARRLRSRVGAVVSIALAVLVARQIESPNQFGYRGGFLLFDLLVAVLIGHLMLCDVEESAVARVFALPPMVMVGKVSYGLYLFHTPVMLWCVQAGLVKHDSVLRAVIEIVLMLVVSAASYRFVELPIRRRRSAIAAAQASAGLV